MNELVSVPISPWYAIPAAVGLLALTFAFLPGLFLHLGVLIYPKGHVRRQEFTAELYTVPFIRRPFWVAGTLVRCLFEGLPARIQSVQLRRSAREPRHRAAKPGPVGWPGLLCVLAAGIAGALCAVTWGLIGGVINEFSEFPFVPTVILGRAAVFGLELFVVAVVVFYLPSLRSGMALGWAVLPSALVSVWIGADSESPLTIVTMIVPVYGVAQAVRASLRAGRLRVRIGSVVAAGAVMSTAALVRLETMRYDAVASHLLVVIGIGVVGGLYVGVGLGVIEHVKKLWDITVSDLDSPSVPE